MNPHLAEGRDQPCLSELGAFVVAVAGKLIDAGRGGVATRIRVVAAA